MTSGNEIEPKMTDDVVPTMKSGDDEETKPESTENARTTTTTTTTTVPATTKKTTSSWSWSILAGRVVFVVFTAGLISSLVWGIIDSQERREAYQGLEFLMEHAQREMMDVRPMQGTLAMAHIAANAIPNATDWPDDAWIEGYSDIAANLLPSSNLLLAPLVRSSEQLADVEDLVLRKNTADDVVEAGIVVNTTMAPTTTPATFGIGIDFDDDSDNENDDEPLLVPIVQQHGDPTLPFLTDVRGLDEESPSAKAAIDAATACAEAQPGNIADCQYIGIININSIDENQPSWLFATPVFPTGDPEVHVGFVLGIVPLGEVFRNMFHQYDHTDIDVDCVFRFSENDAYTYGSKITEGTTQRSFAFLGRRNDDDDSHLENIEFALISPVALPHYLAAVGNQPSVSCYPVGDFVESYRTPKRVFIPLIFAAVIVVASILYFAWNDRCCCASSSSRPAGR